MLITGCFFLVCGTIYNQFGGIIDKELREQSEEEFKVFRAVDDALEKQIRAGIAADEVALTMKDEMTDLFNVKHEIKVAEAEVLTALEHHKYREAIVAKLESLSALEEAAVREIRAKMISKVQADVLNTFKNDKKAKENALNQAIAVLAGGATAKMGKDVVGEVFSQALHNYSAEYAKQPEGSDPVLKKLLQEISVVAQAPVPESKGGNVYTLASSTKAGH